MIILCAYFIFIKYDELLQDMENALGTYSFEIPLDLAPGDYTFAWRWTFRDQQNFTTCWEGKHARNTSEIITGNFLTVLLSKIV